MRIAMISLALAALSLVWLGHQVSRHEHVAFQDTLPAFSSTDVSSIDTVRK